MSVEDSEPHRFEQNIRLSQSEADLGQTSAPIFFFGLFQKFGIFRTKKRAHSKLYLKKSDGYLLTFLGNFAFPLA